MWTEAEIKGLVEKQRQFFRTGKTLEVGWRLEQLRRLKQAILENETAMEEALAADLGRSRAEAYFCDVGSVVMEMNETIRGLRRWATMPTPALRASFEKLACGTPSKMLNNVASSNLCNASAVPFPKRICVASSAISRSSFEWTTNVSSRASVRCSSRRCGSAV